MNNYSEMWIQLNDVGFEHELICLHMSPMEIALHYGCISYTYQILLM